ncbi:MAG TPA: beta-galactosidase [Trebonia sp.]
MPNRHRGAWLAAAVAVVVAGGLIAGSLVRGPQVNLDASASTGRAGGATAPASTKPGQSTAGSGQAAPVSTPATTVARRPAAEATDSAGTPSSAPLWSTQLLFDDNGTPWSEASFAALKADGLTSAEINLSWSAVEPSQGTFSYTELDQELANASAAGMKLVLIFCYSGFRGDPAPWVTSHEVNSSGGQGTVPAWWDPVAEPAYLTYVTDTVKHVEGDAGYGGSILDYGKLDAVWNDGTSNAGGWAADDIDEFRNVYLPDTYGTVAAFNSKNGTSYTSFSQVPAAVPGQPLAAVYQEFRAWSVQAVYGQLTAQVRAITSAPLYYYFGGHIGNAPTIVNIPDVLFALARQYTVTVIEDAAQSPGLALLLSSLGRAYGVPVAMEWTPPGDGTQLAAQAVQWIDNYGMALPDGGGEDFFIDAGTQEGVVGFPIYLQSLAQIKALSGSYPQQPVAVYVDYSQAYGNASGGSMATPENEITDLWDSYQAGFAVVTSQEVNSGIVKLSQFKAVLPTNGVDANLTAYKNAGGTVLSTGSQLAQYAPAYASLANSGVVQIVPDVSPAKTSAQLVLANVTSGTGYDNSITVSPAGLGLAAGTYHVVDASGAAVPQQAVSGGICTEADIPAATLAEWSVVAGAVPPGAAVPANCVGSTPVPCGTLPAGHALAAGQSMASCNDDYTLAMQGDGNLVLYQNGTALWDSGTSGSAATKAAMQSDGNLVLYTSSGATAWNSRTNGNPGAGLTVQNDGNVVIYGTSGKPLWDTATNGK